MENCYTLLVNGTEIWLDVFESELASMSLPFVVLYSARRSRYED